MTVRVKAYAKINLHLDVTAIRADGYHNIESVMQSISLCDVIDVELLDSQKILIECDVKSVPLDEKNIAYKAAKRFFEKLNLKMGARISIKKNIPMAAGLAGGSADGAATLIALNELLNTPMSAEQLCALGAELGADVPFCITCGCMYCDERGDRMTRFVEMPKDTVFVVGCGGEGVSTPEAYKILDEKHDNFVNYEKKGVEALRGGLLLGKNEFCFELFNLFEAPISEKRPIVNEIKSIMNRNGAIKSMMSGSGPSVFGVFSCVEDAEGAMRAIIKAGYFSAIAYPVFERK